MSTPPVCPELTPIERLGRSRARLRSTWIVQQRPARQGRAGACAPRDAAGASPPVGEGTIDLLASMLARWWQRHPLHEAVNVASELGGPAARRLLASTAERHPLRLLALAAGAGALLVALRPWRWLPQAALSSALLTTLRPRGSLTRWLGTGGLASLLTSGELSRLLASLMRPAPDGADAPVAPGAPAAPEAEPASPDAANDPAVPQADAAKR
ncbi:hypothetical protein [Methylibium sp.]|uniref:hypothetical protein n=1 Tax=Methylibium sp. TaxID=2067992 RepID=UPI003D136B8E